ncbi:MAG: oligosaccharide repeat unit polymerase [Ruminococcaceae bacterium]|nr:oligosaccharide repeat unit polymerase [Oscillospiraceae bacterium]
MKIENKRNLIFRSLYTFLGCIAILSGLVLNSVNYFINGLLMVICGVALYFLFAIHISNKNFLDISAVFTGVWLVTIGLASLRLCDYQETWQKETWVGLTLAYLVFQVGVLVSKKIGNFICDFINKYKGKNIGKYTFELKENRLFWICIGVTLMGLLSFTANVLIRGYIPLFSSDTSSYVEFYTKFHIFAVASTMISGLCYYCIKKCNLSATKKVILILCIIYETFLFPILVVSRGVFLATSLSLTAVIFYLNKKRFIILFCCMVVVLGYYELGSLARKYTNAELNVFFEPSKITIDKNNDVDKDDDSDIDDNNNDDTDNNENKTYFQLPPKLSFIYSYLTVSHDNFNEAVQNAEDYTYGIRQLQPFNVILRIPQISKFVSSSEYYLVRPHLNTTNIIGEAYYDLRMVGIAFFMFVWSLIFGTIQTVYLRNKGIFALLALGNVMTPVFLCFFASWMTQFSVWMIWGLELILCIIACTNKISINNGKDELK